MDFAGMIQTWINVVTKPGEDVFEEERHSAKATLSTAIIWVIIAAFVSAIFIGISTAISFVFNIGFNPAELETLLSDIDPALAAEMGGLVGAGAGLGAGLAVAVFCLAFVFAPIGFLISAAIYYGAAKLLGGAGEFEEHTYLLASIHAPLGIVSSVVSVVPMLGSCVSAFIGIYQIVLTYFAMKVTHQLTSGRALMVALAPLALSLLLACCVLGVVFTTIAASAQ